MISAFEWDEAKREANLVKHGVDFVDALKVFADPLRVERVDERRDSAEERRQVVGMVRGQVLFVVYTFRGEVRRLISARERADMSAERITRVVVGPDGKPRKRLPSGRMVPLKGRTSWKRLAEMTEAEVTARARRDADARPVPRKHLGGFYRVSLAPNEVRSIRRQSGLSQAAFAARYAINLRTLQDWEQGRAQPDGPARAYLLVILREPRAVARALAAGG